MSRFAFYWATILDSNRGKHRPGLSEGAMTNTALLWRKACRCQFYEVGTPPTTVTEAQVAIRFKILSSLGTSNASCRMI